MSNRTHAAVHALILLAVVSAGTLAPAGCSSSPAVDPQTEARRWEFREQLILATRAINNADLEQARIHTSNAQARAATFEQNRKVEGLMRLIAGAEALRDGDADRARDEWARIEDPDLSREVRVKARNIGIDIPVVLSERE